MANLSAGVYIKEIDNSAIVPTVSNSVAFFAGNFTKGPIEEPFIITNKTELETYFGKPTNDNYNEWFQCYKFFDYANQLVVSRAYTEGIPTDAGSNGAGFLGGAEFNVDNIDEITVGRYVSNTIDDEDNWSMVTDIVDNGIDSWIVYVEDNLTSTADGAVYVKSNHQNAGTDVYTDVADYQEPFTQSFSLYKNKSDFEYRDGEGIATKDGVKFKAVARTAGSTENVIEIAICNPIDFSDSVDAVTGVTIGTEAQAFEGLPLTNYFQYPPINDEIGIVIKRGTETESFVVSFDETAIDGNNKSKYIENVINDNSELIFVTVDNTQGAELFSQVINTLGTVDYTTYVDSQLYKSSQGTINDLSLTFFGGFSPTVTTGDISNAYNEVIDKEFYEIDIIIGNPVDEGSAAIDLAHRREDCIAFVSGRYQDVVGKRAADATNNLVKYITGVSGAPMRSMFASFFGNQFRIFDNYAKKFRWIDVSGDMAGLRANVNSTRASWWASAGLRRGVIRNIDKIAFTPSEPQRDQLYKNSINPVVSFPGEGNLVWGQKTLLNYASSFDRINVRGLFNTIERAMGKAAKSSVFEFNDPFTRNAILAMFNPYLSTVKAGRGIEDFLVVCDTTNNTPDVISRNELVVDIYIKPTYAAEYIQLNFSNVGTRSFSTVIGA